MEHSDLETVGRVCSGEPQAFRLLVERHGRAVFRLTYRMTANEQDAEDMVQETFLRAFKQIHHFDQRAAFGTWLHRIAANCTLDLLRSRKRREFQTTTRGGDSDFDLMDATPAPHPSPERLAHSREIAGMLRIAMESLSAMELTAFVLRHHEGMHIEEISRALGVQPNAAKHTVFRAVQKLRGALKPALETTS